MDLKDIQQKLKTIRDRIRDEGRVSSATEAELKSILTDTLVTANDEMTAIQNKLTAQLSLRAGNDNALSDDQKKRLRIVEKIGTGSRSIH